MCAVSPLSVLTKRWKINKCRPCLDDWNEAIRINPKYSRAYQQRALAYSYLGENEKAIEDLTKATELDPENVNIRFDRALEYQTIR